MIERTPIGNAAHGPVTAVRMANASSTTLTLADFGCTVLAIETPDRAGRMANITVPPPDLATLLANPEHLGALVGRFANRIRGASFELDGVRHLLPANVGRHHLHGGPGGLQRRPWTLAVHDGAEPQVVARVTSPAGDQGYPGRLDVAATWTLRSDGAIELRLDAVTDAPTVVSLTTHPYFLLARGDGGIGNHRLAVAASRWLPMDADLLPTGALADVAGTPFDLREGRRLDALLQEPHPQLALAGGIDHCLVLDRTDGPAAVLEAPASGRRMRLYTDRPGLQVYSAQHLPPDLRPDGPARGPGAALCLEPQALPDTPNVPAFGSARLDPGQRWQAWIRLEFDAAG